MSKSKNDENDYYKFTHCNLNIIPNIDTNICIIPDKLGSNHSKQSAKSKLSI